MRQSGLKERLMYLGRYRWSSLRGYVSVKRKEPWVAYDTVLGNLEGSRKRYGEFIGEGLQKGYRSLWKELRGQVVLGQEGFLERVKGRWVKGAVSIREVPSLRSLQELEPDEVLRGVATYFKIKPEVLRRKRGGYREERALAMEFMYRYSGISQGEIGEHLGGMDYTAVSRERKRLREKMEHDSKLMRQVNEIDTRLMS
jgi:hypothetical protein